MRSSSLLKIVYINFKKNISSSVFRLNLNHEIRDQFLIKIEKHEFLIRITSSD